MTPRRLVAVAALAIPLLLAGPAPAIATGQEPATDDGQTSVADGDGDGDTIEGGELVSFGISPAGPERPDERPYVAVAGAPGTVVYENVAIINQAAEPIELDVYAGDVIMAEGANLSVTARNEAAFDTGMWIAVQGPETVTVPAQSTETGYGYVIVPLTITIPENAEPGDHVAAVVASLVTVGEGGQDAPSLELEQRVAARIYINVTGEVTPGLLVSNLSTSWTQTSVLGFGTMTVGYTLTNTGNVRMGVDPSVSISGPFGLLPNERHAERLDELLPGTTVDQEVTVEGVFPLFREQVVVMALPVPPVTGGDPGLGVQGLGAQVWIIPWAVVGLLVLVVAVVVWRILAKRARRKRLSDLPAGTRRARRAGKVTSSAGDADESAATKAEPKEPADLDPAEPVAAEPPSRTSV